MKKVLVMFASILLLTSCATTSKLYYWGSTLDGVSKYEQLAYKHYNQQTPESICELIALYEDMTNNPGGTRNVAPPGIYAEYGFLLLQTSTLDAFENHATRKHRNLFDTNDYAKMFQEKGIKMLQKEIELYPESEKFILPILTRIKDNINEED